MVMTKAEKLAKASLWWNEYRGAVRSTFNLSQEAPAVRSAISSHGKAMGAPAVIVKGETKETIQDGILSGLPWHQLTTKEQMIVADVWHHNHVIVPENEDAKLKDMRRVGHGSLVGSEKSKTKHAGKPASTSRWSFNKGNGDE